MYQLPSKFSRYFLDEREQREAEELLKNSILQAHIHNMQADLADAMTALLPDKLEDTEYRVMAAKLQGGILAYQTLIREINPS